MAMDPRTHPRGSPPDFSMVGLPANPNPTRITNALWWLVCMRLKLEPLSESGGVYANKAGYHNAGENLPDHGLGDSDTDHSIRRAPDRTGPWWQEFASAHDWTFTRAHTGNYTEIKKYTNRLVNAMRSLTDLRPDDVYAYTIGQIDDDRVVEGWNEYTDDDETGDDSHLWHRHDSFRRNIVGSFQHMWKALTIDMGWTYAEWQESVEATVTNPTAQQNADAVWTKDIDPTAGTYSALGGVWTILNRSAILNQLPGSISELKDALDKLVADDDVEFDALAASLVLVNAKLDMLLAEPNEAHPFVKAIRFVEANPTT